MTLFTTIEASKEYLEIEIKSLPISKIFWEKKPFWNPPIIITSFFELSSGKMLRWCWINLPLELKSLTSGFFMFFMKILSGTFILDIRFLPSTEIDPSLNNLAIILASSALLSIARYFAAVNSSWVPATSIVSPSFRRWLLAPMDWPLSFGGLPRSPVPLMGIRK